METFIPDLCRYSGQQSIRFVAQGDQEVRLNVSQLDPLRQLITSQQIVLSEQGVRLYPVGLRYAWPSELDLMARLAGLQLKQRWGNWQKGPFVAESIKYISVYEPSD